MKLVWSEGGLSQGGGGGEKRKLREGFHKISFSFFCLKASLLVTYIPVALSRKLFEDPCDEPRNLFPPRFRFRARVRCCARALCSLFAHKHSQHLANLCHGQPGEAKTRLFCASWDVYFWI